MLLALMALQFRRYPQSQIFAFDFGGSIRAATIAMGGDWHDIGGVLLGESAEFVEASLEKTGTVGISSLSAFRTEKRRIGSTAGLSSETPMARISAFLVHPRKSEPD